MKASSSTQPDPLGEVRLAQNVDGDYVDPETIPLNLWARVLSLALDISTKETLDEIFGATRSNRSQSTLF